MADPIQQLDGHSLVFGMDGDVNASALKPGVVSKAVNRIFRGGNHDTRPPFNEITLVFEEGSGDEELFRYGNVQGITTYLKTTPGRLDGLVVSIAGTIFYIALVNETGYVNRVIDGNDKEAMHAFFVQAEEWLYVQDGHTLPVFWDGIHAATRSGGEAANQMPIGTIMTYAHGRIFVSNDKNELKASDVMFGDNFTSTTNVQNFTEITYWQEGGSFVVPSYYGPISGLITLPALGDLRGQGELVAMAPNGAMSFAVNLPRLSWKDAQIQRTAILGNGCVAPYSLIAINGDAWYKTRDGLATYSNSKLDFSSRFTFRDITRSANNWLKFETDDLKRYASSIHFDKRILSTVLPQLSLTRSTIEGAGAHRYHLGVISIDLDISTSMVGGEQINFDGLWTGIRPTAMVTLRERAFAMSYDPDGKNRLYEFSKVRGDDNNKKQIRSSYTTRRMACSPTGSSEFFPKKLIGGELWVSQIGRPISVSVLHRPDQCPDWFSWIEGRNIGNTHILAKRIDKHIRIGSPDQDLCRPATTELVSEGCEFQAVIKITGNARVDRFRIFTNQISPVTVIGDPCVDLLVNEMSEQGLTQDDFEYSIVEP